MSLNSIVQYATLFSLMIGILGLAIAIVIHRQQVTTQIFLAVSDRYDELLKTSPTGLWMTRGRSEADLPEPSDEITISVLRHYGHFSFSYFLFRQGRIPANMWKLLLPSMQHTLLSPLFVREWKVLRFDFETFPDFIAFVRSIQEGNPKE